MAWSGMSPTQIQSVAREISGQASDLAAIKRRLDSLVSQATRVWQGADARRFQNQWSSEGRSNMTKAHAMLQELSKTLFSEAQAQLDTSTAYGSGPLTPNNVYSGTGSQGYFTPQVGPGSIGFETGAGVWAGAGATAAGETELGPFKLEGEAGAFAGAKADATADVTLDKDGLTVKGEAGAMAGAEAGAKGSVKYGEGLGQTELEGEVKAMAGVEAKAKGSLHADLYGLEAEGKAEAIAGARVEG
ncbi:MAG: WXG100 family type VII secretion target, partial [Propionibacteriaceae bacterium]|nr:WXG100 family type VII secretion target [Propionibacteriaceae bacterium]